MFQYHPCSDWGIQDQNKVSFINNFKTFGTRVPTRGCQDLLCWAQRFVLDVSAAHTLLLPYLRSVHGIVTQTFASRQFLFEDAWSVGTIRN
jgi:hypothetical protein